MKRVAIAGAALAVGLVPLVAALAFRDSGSGPSAPPSGPYRGSEPPPGIRAPDFALRSYRGQVVRMRDLRGKVAVVTFLDTKCTESCPIIASQIGSAIPLLSLQERSEVAALAVSVEPRVDTPVNVRRFLRARHALGTLEFLIGSEPALRPVWKAFHVLPAVDTGSSDVHSADVRVFDKSGAWVSTLHVGVDLTPANLAHDIRTAIRS